MKITVIEDDVIKGDLVISCGETNATRDIEFWDEVGNKFNPPQFSEWYFYLNHSCDEWVIGDGNKAEQMAEDLLTLTTFMKAEGYIQ